MSRIDTLLANFQRHVSLPLRPNLPFKQRVWFLVYPPEDERRLRLKKDEFEMAAKDQDLGWLSIDLSGSYADWIDTIDEDERESVLAVPEIAESYAEEGFREFLRQHILGAMDQVTPDDAPRTIIALSGLLELYDFIHVSDVINDLGRSYPGVLLAFFPGERRDNTYRFLSARHGWDYLAIPILAEATA